MWLSMSRNLGQVINPSHSNNSKSITKMSLAVFFKVWVKLSVLLKYQHVKRSWVIETHVWKLNIAMAKSLFDRLRVCSNTFLTTWKYQTNRQLFLAHHFWLYKVWTWQNFSSLFLASNLRRSFISYFMSILDLFMVYCFTWVVYSCWVSSCFRCMYLLIIGR